MSLPAPKEPASSGDARLFAPAKARPRPAILAEFQPDAIEIEERPPPRLARTTFYAMAALIVCGIGWASVSEVDQIVVAKGKLVNTAPNLLVQPLETSVIRTIDVAVGQTVRAGDVLATLDPTFAQADAGLLRARLADLTAQIQRLEAEITGDAFVLGQSPGREVVMQAAIFQQRKAHVEAELRNHDARIGVIEANMATAVNDQKALADRMAVLREIENMRASLFVSQTGSKLNLLEARHSRLTIESDLGHLRSRIAEIGRELEQARSERQAFIEGFRRTSIEELGKLNGERAGVVEELNKAEMRRRMVVLTAPADAIVLDVAQRSIGSVIQQAEPMVTLVPLDVPLEVEALIETKDIGHVAVDQAVRIKLDALPFQKHGTIPGTVRTISEDAFTQQEGQNGSATLHVYRARVKPGDGELRETPQTFHLMPGMTLVAEIKVGRRSVLSYLIYPLLRGIDESIREP
jgi:HlyD family secretion protein